MANRREKLDQSDPFKKRPGQLDGLSLDTLTGAMARPEVVSQAVTVNIYDIYPDPAQPRRTIPAALRGDWQPNPLEMGKFLDHWRDQLGIDPAPYFDPPPDFERTEHSDPQAQAFIQILDLAVSIHSTNGLINPITVVRNGENFFIETGERRWMAYHLLYQVFRGKWQHIPAVMVRQASVWKQAYENNARDDLNAISKARQLAILLMDLHGADQFRPLRDFPHELDFYAQAIDVRVPRGKGEQLLTAMGLSHIRQISQYRSLLALPHEAWTIADDYSLSEYRLRQIIDQKLDDSTTVELVQQAALDFGDDTGTVVPVSPGRPKGSTSDLEPWERPFLKLRRLTPGKLQRFDAEKKQRVEAYLDELENWIADLRKHL